ncbi:MAG TPA: HEAT repeat domain-containing protein [Gemmatimonadales bacterium]|nr:HEAT repeat domain-containing protein [Gemmatimonadales bacterium]
MAGSSTRPSPADRLAALNAAVEGADRQPAILAALEDEAPAVRERAIRLAARYVEPTVLGELVADEANAVRRNAAITALERQGPYAVPQLQTMLGHAQIDVVMFALQVLSRIGDPAAARAILPLVGHSDLNVAQSAIQALGQLRSDEAVPALLELLRSELWLQLAAIDALGAIGDPRAVAPLVELVPDSVVAEPALQALQRLAAPESLEPLLGRLMIVRERSLRDALLLAVGVVIDLHPEPGPAAAHVAEELALGHGNGLLQYLEQVLQGSAAPAEGHDEGDLLRAAAALTVVARLAALLPLVLVRVAEPEGAPWAEALFRRHPEALRASLEGLLEHQDPRLRRGTLLAATFDPGELSRLAGFLSDPEPEVRAAACRALAQTGMAEVAPLLAERLRAGEPVERSAAVQAFTLLPAGALAELEPCLAPGAPDELTLRALDALAARPHTLFETRLVELVGSRSADVRRAALRAIAQLPGSRAELALIRALADRDLTVQIEALELLVRRGGEKAEATLLAMLGARDSLRYHVIRALGHLGAVRAVSRLRSLYPECGPYERVEIVWALIRIGPPDLAEFLLARLAEPETELRRVAAHGVAELADPARLPLLLTLGEDPDWNVRNEAARGLGLLGLERCRPALLTLARDVEPVVARTARKALDQLPAVAIPA